MTSLSQAIGHPWGYSHVLGNGDMCTLFLICTRRGVLCIVLTGNEIDCFQTKPDDVLMQYRVESSRVLAPVLWQFKIGKFQI